MQRILIANRGEVAVRVARAAADLGIATVAVWAADDAGAPYLATATTQAALPGQGAAAYLDISALITIATANGCDALHPGWGFVSEQAALAHACDEAGITLIGPSAAHLALFGDKARARELAVLCGVPVAMAADDVAGARALLAGGPIMLKAAAGGGGRGMREVHDAAVLDGAWAAASSEALRAFGDGTIFAERLISQARHIEVQIAGDGHDVVSLGTRDCTLQRNRQKLVETAPAHAPAAITEAALTMARTAGYRSLGTWEFLVFDGGFVFIEVNARLQVEHTVTEAVTGLDLAAIQIRLSQGASLAALGLDVPPNPRGFAMQMRINAERLLASGDAVPTGGTIARFVPPSGPGIRVDHAAGEGFALSVAFDSLLAKLIVHAPDRDAAIIRARRALDEFVVAGVTTNILVHQKLLAMPMVIADTIDTRFVDRNAAHLAMAPSVAIGDEPAGSATARAPMPGSVVAVHVAIGDAVGRGATIAVIEAMKMQMPVLAPASGIVRALHVGLGDVLADSQAVAVLDLTHAGDILAVDETVDLDFVRADLAALNARLHTTLDAGRPDAVARRHAAGKRMVRENLGDLFDSGSFAEYGGLALAAQRRRRSMEELIRVSPADGLVAGIGTVDEKPTAALAYDYTVMAGTQGFMNHKKTDRLLRVVHDTQLPLVLFAEGGGGRPGDTDVMGVAGLDLSTFAAFARLSGRAPVLGIASGYCFAGNAALLGCCDTIIATQDSSIGMGGPAMIEGGGLGVVAPELVGPVSVQVPNGVIDLLVADEAAAVIQARRYLGYFSAVVRDFTCADQRNLRACVPEDRKRIYAMRGLIDILADTDSVLELREKFAPGMITALLRIGGNAMGVIANNPAYLGGAIDATGADKAARFLQLCQAHGLPVLSLCDTPGFMVGTDIERAAQVRHVCRMFVVGANLTVPLFCVIPRKGYGLGAIAMAGGGFHESHFTIAWPSGEFGGMGLEGAVRLGYRRELEAITDVGERQAMFEKMVAKLYAEGQAMNMAAFLEIDAVIDPAETRDWILRGLKSAGPRKAGAGRSAARFIDTW